MWTIKKKVFIEFVKILLLLYVSGFFSGHVGSELLDWGLNLYPLHRKANS